MEGEKPDPRQPEPLALSIRVHFSHMSKKPRGEKKQTVDLEAWFNEPTAVFPVQSIQLSQQQRLATLPRQNIL